MKYQFARKNILVTGGAGFLGSHLCEELVKENKVICLDNLVGGGGNIVNIEYLLQNPNFRFIKQDINQPFNLEEFPELKDFKIKVQGIQEIYHLACPTTARNFMQMRMETLKANSIGMINILEIARKYQAKFLFASSSVVYGPRNPNNLYFKESDWGQVNLISSRACYDEGKRFAETCCVTYREFYNLETKIVRIFRTYGPRLALFDGQMISDFALQALNNKPLIIYGDENFASSLCYVSDIVEGMMAMMNSNEVGPINLGHPEQYKLVDVAQKIISLTGSKSTIVFKEPLPFITPLGLPDITLAKTKLNWFPVVSLDEGLAKTVKYIKTNWRLLQPLVEKYDQE
ncbi:MAG: GDP-mannose 4,6-dehydratase [Patescibacteria group bacterium]